MSDDVSSRSHANDASASFEALIDATLHASPESQFTTTFRGYDKEEVDATVADLTARVREQSARIAALAAQTRQVDDTDAAITRLEEELTDVKAQGDAALDQAKTDAATFRSQANKTVKRLQGELAAAQLQIQGAEQRREALAEEIAAGDTETPGRPQFEEILRVAEEQASVLVRNASVQGERLLEASRAEVEARRKEAQSEGEAIRSAAQHDAQQVRLRIDTELTAHQARVERETAHAAEKISQAEQEAAAMRSEAEKGAAALRAMVARETTHARTEAEEAVRELRMRALEFESSLTRRQDDAQQEFLVLHNQAVAHAERITVDANEQVAASLDHAQRISAKADDFEKLMRAQSQQIEADANLRAGEQLDGARVKAQRIIDTVTTLAQSALRDAEDRTRDLRWQQHQLTSFMAEVKELIRPESSSQDPDAAPAPSEPAQAVEVDEAIEETTESDAEPQPSAP